MREIYVVATGQNRGKTTASLGLINAFVERGLQVGFMKPVGQRTVMDEGFPADEDAVLMKDVFGLTDPYPFMSPVHIPRGFTKSYITGDVVEDLGARIRQAHAHFSDREILLVEGTGHAGVGAVIGLSNAVVASMLDAPVIIVSEGGIGKPIDEIVMNAALYQRHGVRVAGAIVNKIDLDSQPDIPFYLERGLAPYGIPLLGVLPFRKILANPTLGMIEEKIEGETLSNAPDLNAVVGDIAVGAAEAQHVLQRVGPRTLVIVPGDREDIITAITTAHIMGRPREVSVAELSHFEMTPNVPPQADPGPLGLVLTEGYRPRTRVLEAIQRAGLFATAVESDTYAVTEKIQGLLVKTLKTDAGKIETIKSLVRDNLDIDRVLEIAHTPVLW